MEDRGGEEARCSAVDVSTAMANRTTGGLDGSD